MQEKHNQHQDCATAYGVSARPLDGYGPYQGCRPQRAITRGMLSRAGLLRAVPCRFDTVCTFLSLPHPGIWVRFAKVTPRACCLHRKSASPEYMPWCCPVCKVVILQHRSEILHRFLRNQQQQLPHPFPVGTCRTYRLRSAVSSDQRLSTVGIKSCQQHCRSSYAVEQYLVVPRVPYLRLCREDMQCHVSGQGAWGLLAALA